MVNEGVPNDGSYIIRGELSMLDAKRQYLSLPSKLFPQHSFTDGRRCRRMVFRSNDQTLVKVPRLATLEMMNVLP